MKYIYILIGFIIASLIFLALIQDYQARMVIHNANYQCIYGSEKHCNYLQELEMRGEL